MGLFIHETSQSPCKHRKEFLVLNDQITRPCKYAYLAQLQEGVCMKGIRRLRFSSKYPLYSGWWITVIADGCRRTSWWVIWKWCHCNTLLYHPFHHLLTAMIRQGIVSKSTERGVLSYIARKRRIPGFSFLRLFSLGFIFTVFVTWPSGSSKSAPFYKADVPLEGHHLQDINVRPPK